MRMFGLLPRPLGSIFRKLTHLTCNSRHHDTRRKSGPLGCRRLTRRSERLANWNFCAFYLQLAKVPVRTRTSCRQKTVERGENAPCLPSHQILHFSLALLLNLSPSAGQNVV